jgi:hypothetical protein
MSQPKRAVHPQNEGDPVALSNRFHVSMEDVFPHGAYVVSEVEPVRDFDKSTRERMVQQHDKDSGLPVWSVSVLDADPMARKTEKTVTIKIAAQYQPVPPQAGAGMPFPAVEFDGLTVTPYLDDKRNRVAYSFRASSMRAPAIGKPSHRSSSTAEAA